MSFEGRAYKRVVVERKKEREKNSVSNSLCVYTIDHKKEKKNKQ